MSGPEAGSALTLAVEHGQVVFRQASAQQPRKLQSIAQWASAFHTFMAIYSLRHPLRLGESLQYAETVHTAAAQFPGFGRRSYDEQFRLHQEVCLSRSWALLDTELWVTVAAASCFFSFAVSPQLSVAEL